jgi:ACS family hexuronate transporter-like MFS transporter
MNEAKPPVASSENTNTPRAPASTGDTTGPSQSSTWVWWISGLLLLATMLNYMDRQTLANLAVRIKNELLTGRENELYGNLEWGFGWAFAAGSLFFGFLSDRISVRFLYPGVLLAWSSIGVLTGYCNSYETMLACRILLGFFEAGHWPCALRTTKIVLNQKNRTMGNSILQSGGAIGAILTPPIILLIIGDNTTPGAWRSPFIIIGSMGVAWAFAWLLSVGRDDLPAPVTALSETPDRKHNWLKLSAGLGVGIIVLVGTQSFWRLHLPSGTAVREYFDQHPFLITCAAIALCFAAAGAGDRSFLRECLGNRRFWTLVPVVICINLTWQLIRAWLPSFLQEGRGATERAALMFNSVYYIAADVGCIAAGAGSLWLSSRGVRVLSARLIVFGICAATTSLTIAAAALPLGWGLYAILVIVAAGSLGVFPCYYSFSQETSEQHMGKTAGLLGALAWLVSSPMQKEFGKLVDATHSFDQGLALAGLAPVVAWFVLLIAWPKTPTTEATPTGSTR